MELVTEDDATAYDLHGATFTSFVAPSRGSEQLCAWRLDIPAGRPGVAHRITHEEVLLVLGGTLHAGIDARTVVATAGDAVRLPAGSTVRVGTGDRPLTAWVTTSVGLRAVTGEGASITPPWTR